MSFNSLPVEIAQEVLSRLPVRSLHAFALTSRASSVLARNSLRTLALGVFHTQISGLVSFMDAPSHLSSAFAVSVILARRDAKTRPQTIRNQNAVAARILRHHGRSLRELELVLWELDKPLADALTGLPNLHHLSLRFDHPYVRHPNLERRYWDSAPTGTVWNLLSSSSSSTTTTTTGGEEESGSKPRRSLLGRLESLTLQRSGITDYQLERLVQQNPHLVELRLQKCLSLTQDFFEYLATRSPIADRLAILHVTHNRSRDIDERILPHIAKLTGLKVFFFLFLLPPPSPFSKKKKKEEKTKKNI